MPDLYNLSDVFISYSRRDRTFVERLAARFKTDEREVWVDWQDIPESVDWWAEVRAGIEGADTFLFVVSPDSVASEICFKEIQHALDNHKRFIPLLYRDIQAANTSKTIHPAVSQHNWLFFRETDDFESAFQGLQRVLATDIQHTRAHTRYLVQAREWDMNGRDAVYLLPEGQVHDAEVWLAASEGKTPAPSDLQTAYIQAGVEASRKRADAERERQARELVLQRRAANRLRYLVGVLGIFLAAAIIVGVVLISLLAIQQRFVLSVESTLALAERYLHEGQFGEAVAEFTRVIQLDPNQTDAYYSRAVANSLQGRYSEALGDYDFVLSQQPDFVDALYNRGLAYALIGENDSAITDFNRALELSPRLTDALNNRGQVYLNDNRREVAIADFQAALALDPEHQEAGNNLALLGATDTIEFTVQTNGLRVRTEPRIEAESVGTLTIGTVIKVKSDTRTDNQYGVWWRHDQGWSMERTADGSGIYLTRVTDTKPGFSPLHTGNLYRSLDTETLTTADGTPLRVTPLFERLPLDISYISAVQYYGNTRDAFRNGSRLGYTRYSQGLNGGLDLISNRENAPVYAGVEGVLRHIGLIGANQVIQVQNGNYVIWYFHLHNLPDLSLGEIVTPDTVLGYLHRGIQVSLDIRFRDRYLVNALWLMPNRVRDPLLHKFQDYASYFYRSNTWNQWLTPLDQPVIQIGGNVIGPFAESYYATEESDSD